MRRSSSAWQSKRLIIAVSPVQVRPPLQPEERLIVAKSDVRPKITLACVECKNRNYITRKNRRNDPDRIELKKFCPTCKKHTEHKETR